MQEDQTNKLRLRIRLKTGEEFEAEGDAAFIARQKDAFLSLINGKEDAPKQSSAPRPFNGTILTPSAPASRPQILPSYLKAAQNKAIEDKNNILLPSEDVWDKIAYTDGQDIIIRRKDKNIKASSAALIILGAAKVLKNQQELSALELSKSLKLSGYLKGDLRLDRAISAEIKDAAIIYEGSKRNRLYRLTQKGLAKAFTTAEKALISEDKHTSV